MAGADAAAWAQAYLSAAAIVVSGGLAVLVPWNERRLARKRQEESRLNVQCERSDSTGLRLRISYLPEFRNHAVGANIEVIEPKGAYVFQGVILGQNEYGDHSDRVIPGRLDTTLRYNAVPLLETNNRDLPRGTHEGIMFIEYDLDRTGPKTAKIKVSILRHGNHLVMSKIMRVSPIDETHYQDGPPVAILKGSDDL